VYGLSNAVNGKLRGAAPEDAKESAK